MSTTKAEPCRYCHARPEPIEIREGLWAIGCENDLCREWELSAETEQEAVDAWNARSREGAE